MGEGGGGLSLARTPHPLALVGSLALPSPARRGHNNRRQLPARPNELDFLGPGCSAGEGLAGAVDDLSQEWRRDFGRGSGCARRLHRDAIACLGLLYPRRSGSSLLPILVWRRDGGALAAADR